MASWSNTCAWMVDQDGYAVPVDNHVQKGEDPESQLDEGGIACALRYAKMIRDKRYYVAAAVLAQEEVFLMISFDELTDKIDLEEEVRWLVEPQNVQLYLEALNVPSFQMTAEEVIELYKERHIEENADKARLLLHTLYERLMMRVRVGGLINTSSYGTTDIYFRIPDTQVNGWYTAIGNFLYDYPQYSGFTLHIYQEADTAAERRELESYTDSKQFLDIHACRARYSYKEERLNAAYKRKQLMRKRFLMSLKHRN